jgi:hypothetical protein
MRALILLVTLLALSGCGPGSNYAIAHGCREEVGPEPIGVAGAFGLLGAVAILSNPEHQAWEERREACIAREKAQRT